MQCGTECARDEACVADPKSTDPSLGKCEKVESFDAGPIAFSGTAMAISLFPPYSYEAKSDGSPFADEVRERDVTWVEPELVAQIGFSECTRDGRLRHPRFLGLRDDKPAREVVREAR